MDVEHLRVGQPNHNERARIHTDDVVAELARQNEDLAPLGACFGGRRSSRCTGADDYEIGVLPAHRCRRVVRWSHRIDRGIEAEGRTADDRVADNAQAGLGGGETGPREGDAVDLRAAVAAIACQAQRASVLGMLAGAHDRDGDRIARGILDWLVVNRDAHVPVDCSQSTFLGTTVP
jgi:hypothetical protein